MADESTIAAPDAPGSCESLPCRVLRTCVRILLGLVVLLAVSWGTLALYYSNLPWPNVRLGMSVVFGAYCVWALWQRKPYWRWMIAGLLIAIILWHASIRPSHDRPWRPEVAIMPRAMIDGDHVRLTGVRDFHYRSRDDFDIRYEERDVQISHLTSLDLLVSYWKLGPVAHTFVTFHFDNASPICISIETRPEVGEGFSPLASLFKQFELIYVVGNERDIVGVRTNHRGEEVFLYPIRTSRESAQELFRIYLRRINELADRAEFYHLLSNSCTINIIRYANSAGRVGRFDIGHLLNGWIDQYLYRSGRVDTSLPFEESRRRAHINTAVREAGDAEDFSSRIRSQLSRGQGESVN